MKTWEDMSFFDTVIAVMTLALPVISIIALCCLPSLWVEYTVKMKTLSCVDKAIDKGLELRLNGDLLKGIDLVKTKE